MPTAKLIIIVVYIVLGIIIALREFLFMVKKYKEITLLDIVCFIVIAFIWPIFLIVLGLYKADKIIIYKKR